MGIEPSVRALLFKIKCRCFCPALDRSYLDATEANRTILLPAKARRPPHYQSLLSLHRQQHVIALAFAQQQMLAEEQILRRDSTLEIRLAHIIHVNTSAFDVLASLAL